MRDSEIKERKYHFVCFRCGYLIRIGEKMVSLSVSVETPTEDGGLNGREATTISSLCSGCASILFSQAIMRDPGLMMPRALDTEDDEEEDVEEETNEESGYFRNIQDMLETVYYGSASEDDAEVGSAEYEERIHREVTKWGNDISLN